jgi:site-specific DNA-methyltransferase (adenine-specific)
MEHLNYNPDVLSCLANLSNDEVFTPPEVVNKMLDLLPSELWSNPNAKFLDPVSKTGVFLREIAKRLMQGLATAIPDVQERVNHIFGQQLYGIAITELTSLVSRRSVYCTKTANNPYSVCTTFTTPDGNIRYVPARHHWENGRCTFCGASKEVYDRGDAREAYAYQFIHTHNPEKIFNMKFDVIIGNPPYQLSDGGGRDSAAIPLYNKFVEQAMKLRPRFLCMIIPARWYSGGRGLDDFREKILNDRQMRVIYDYPETKDCFPGVNIRGGICYFLWEKDSKGDCKITNCIKGIEDTQYRPLLEKGTNIFIRYNRSISILRKVQKFKEQSLSEYVSSSKPFGMRSNFDQFSTAPTPMRHIKLYRFGEDGYISEAQVLKLNNLVGKYKVLVSKASPGGDEYPHMIVSKPIISEPNSACTETYLVIKNVKSKKEAENLVSYIKTRFFRFMMSLVKNTQNISKASYQFVPLQDFSEPWTDEKLYAKYTLTQEEIAFIESMIRPME